MHTRSKPLRSAYDRGAASARAAADERACPYKPSRGWPSVWRAYWMRGYQKEIQPEFILAVNNPARADSAPS